MKIEHGTNRKHEPPKETTTESQSEHGGIHTTRTRLLTRLSKVGVVKLHLKVFLCPSWSLQVLAYSAACVGVSAFSGGLIDAAKADEVMNTLRSMTEESQQVSGSAAHVDAWTC